MRNLLPVSTKRFISIGFCSNLAVRTDSMILTRSSSQSAGGTIARPFNAALSAEQLQNALRSRSFAHLDDWKAASALPYSKPCQTNLQAKRLLRKSYSPLKLSIVSGKSSGPNSLNNSHTSGQSISAQGSPASIRSLTLEELIESVPSGCGSSTMR